MHRSIRLGLATVVVAGLSVATLAGCSSSPATSASGTAASGTQLELLLGVSGSPFYEAMACGAKEKATALGATVNVSAPDTYSGAAQVPLVQAVGAKSAKGLIIAPADAQLLVTPLKAVAAAGTKIVAADNTIADTSILSSQVLTDNEAGGRKAADALAKAIGGKGSVMSVGNPPGGSTEDARRKGFTEQLKQYPGITDLGAQYATNDPQKIAGEITATLAAHPDLAGVFATNDQNALGAVTGAKQAGVAGTLKIVAYDASAPEVTALRAGTIEALIAQDPMEEGRQAVQLVMDAIAGKTVAKAADVPLVVLTAADDAAVTKYEYKASC